MTLKNVPARSSTLFHPVRVYAYESQSGCARGWIFSNGREGTSFSGRRVLDHQGKAPYLH